MQCGASLTPQNKFCPDCGHPVVRPRFAAPEDYTPRRLADKILAASRTLEGERRQVTVLFADLKGSMELVAPRDPEEALGILDPMLELMMEAVHRYEGVVNQVMGDGCWHHGALRRSARPGRSRHSRALRRAQHAGQPPPPQ